MFTHEDQTNMFTDHVLLENANSKIIPHNRNTACWTLDSSCSLCTNKFSLVQVFEKANQEQKGGDTESDRLKQEVEMEEKKSRHMHREER